MNDGVIVEILCDCNRLLFFQRALGLPECMARCGNGLFAVDWIKADGSDKVIYCEP